MSISCACGSVVYEATGAPIAIVSCFCDDCQEAARRLEALDKAPAVRGDAADGTDYVLYRKDRVRAVQGQERLQEFRLKAGSATKRMVAPCCNSAMYLDFDKGHWLSVYRGRVAEAAPVQMRIQTKFLGAGAILSPDLPAYSRFPPTLLAKLLLSRLAMLFSGHRR